MLTEHAYIEIAVILVGGSCAAMVLRTGSVRGIGPQIRLTLAVCLIVPMIVILGLEKILNGETIAAVVGALVGAGIPASGGGTSTGSEKPK